MLLLQTEVKKVLRASFSYTFGPRGFMAHITDEITKALNCIKLALKLPYSTVTTYSLLINVIFILNSNFSSCESCFENE